jgi:peptide/nickel transport system permease protein
MIRLIIRRILLAVPLLWGLATILFIILRLAPGDPSYYFLSEQFSPEVKTLMEKNLGLHESLPVQYLKWLESTARGDLQLSLIDERPVLAHILEALPPTLLLSSVSLLLIFGGGILLGTLQAYRKKSIFDRATSLLSLLIYSIPSFWLSVILILVFALKMPLFPASQIASTGAESLTSLNRLLDALHHLALPAVALSLGPAAAVARYLRAGLIDCMGQDYIRTAGAKGLARSRIVLKHGLRNALLPVITLLGLYLPVLLSGSVLVETIFAWPGMGRLMVLKILQRDYPVVMGTTLFYGAAVVLGSLLADILYAAADPRIRYKK